MMSERPSLSNRTLSTGENTQFPENDPTSENSKLQSELNQLQQDNKELRNTQIEGEHELENNEDQTTSKKDQGSCLKWGLIGAAAGIVVGLLIPKVISKIRKWNKSNHSRRLDVKAGRDERETFLPRVEARRESKILTGQFTETVNETETTIDQISKLKSNLKQLQQDNKHLCDTQNAVKHELETQKLEKDKLQSINKLLHDTLNKVQTELGNQKDQLVQKLQDVETKRKKNKEEVQMVEKKIFEKETSEDKDLLLREKEELFKSQWKLDEEKKRYERQILNIEKVMEPIEMNMMRATEKNKDV